MEFLGPMYWAAGNVRAIRQHSAWDWLNTVMQTGQRFKHPRGLRIPPLSGGHFVSFEITFDHERVQRMIKKIRQARPDYVITHGKNDLFNPNHNEAAKPFFSCCVQLNSVGVRMEGLLNIKQMTIYGFEPHQVEILGYVPASWWTLPGPMIRR